MPDVSDLTLRPISGADFISVLIANFDATVLLGAQRSRNASLQISPAVSFASGTIASTSVLWDRINRDKAAPSGGIS